MAVSEDVVEKALVAEFAEVVVSESEPFDAVECAGNFARITGERGINRMELYGQDAIFLDLELETRLWQLVERVNDVKRTHGTKQDMLEATLDWLRMGVEPLVQPDLETVKWPRTLAHVTSLNESKAENGNASTVSLLVTELDADAPIRENKAVSSQDAEADATAFKYVFELVRAGNIAKASEVCAHTNNWSLKVAIDAATTAPKPSSSSSLVRRVCAAAGKVSGLGEYERGIYGLLGGDIDPVLPLCPDWQTYLLACVTSVDLSSNEMPPSPKSPGSRDLLEPPHSVHSIAAALRLVNTSSNHQVATQAKELHRRVMHEILLDNTGKFINELTTQAENDSASGNASNNLLLSGSRPWLVRVLLHLQLMLSEAPTAATEILMRIYVEDLRIKGLWAYIPGYVSLLEPKAQHEIYPHVLAYIQTADLRQQQLELMQTQGRGRIDVRENVLATIRMVLNNTALPGPLPSDAVVGPTLADTPELTEDDERLFDALNWLMGAQLYDDAVDALVDLSRVYLLAGQPLAVVSIGAQLQRAVFIRHHSNNSPQTDEAYAYVQLSTALRHIIEWDSRDETIADPSISKTELVAAIQESVRPVLDFMVKDLDNETLVQLRDMYVPFILFELLRILGEAKKLDKHYLTSAIGFASVIADEDLKLYQLFEASGQLKRLLDVFAELWVDTL